MTVFFIFFYVGGATYAYRANRAASGRFFSFCEAIAWPWGLGYGIAWRFYYDPDLAWALKTKEPK